LRKWVITLCLLPLLAAAYTKNIGDTRSVMLWVSFSFVGLLLVGAIDAVLHRTLFRNRREHPVPAWWVGLDSVVGGLIIGVCAWWGASLGNANDPSQLAARIPSIALLGGLWGVFLTLLLDYRERASRARNLFIDEMVQFELMKAQQSVIVEEVIQAVRKETVQEIDRIRGVMSNLESLPVGEAAAVLRSSAKDAIGPLSKQLWMSVKDSYPRVRLWNVLSHAVRTQPFRPLALAALTLCLSFADRVSRIGVTRGIVVTALVVLLIIPELSFANFLMRRFPALHSRIFLASLLIVEIQTIWVVIWEKRIVDAPVDPAEIGVSVLASLFIIFLTVGLQSFDLLRGEVTRFVRGSVEDERIQLMARDRQIGAAVREMARELHGSVQTRLVSCALALDMAAEAGDSGSMNAALLEARRILEPDERQVPGTVVSIESEVLRKVDVWKLLCACTTAIDVASHTSECASRVGRVVEEAITNAVRHGGATAVEIEIRQHGKDVQVRVADDGRGPANGEQGLGSAILDHATEGRWVLEAGDTGAVLTAMVPNN
jgi:signal transduction histidine kinase